MNKGQVTFFIIIGILLVMIIGTIVFVSLPSAPIRTPSEFAPVEVMLSSCTEEAIIETLRLGALAGGNPEIAYYSLDAEPSDIPFLQNTPVAFTQNHEIVPYFVYYEMPCNSNDCIKSLKSDIQGNFIQRNFKYDNNDYSVEAQLSRIASIHTKECIEELLNLDEDFSYSNLAVGLKNTIIDEKIVYETRLTGNIRRGDSSVSAIITGGTIESSFKTLYDSASYLSLIESQTGFSSFMIMDILSLESSSRGKYPPIWSLDLGYTISSWTSQAVSEDLKDDMDSYFSMIRLTDSSLVNALSSYDETPYVLQRSMLDLRSTTTGRLVGDDAILSFVPSYNKPELTFSGRHFTMGEPLDAPLPIVASLLPLRSYRTYYNIRTPIIYEIQSKEDGLVFRYAVESLIKNNVPVYANSFPTTILSQDFDDEIPELYELSDAYCNSPQGSMINVEMIDGSTGTDLSSGLILFSCEHASCTYEYDGTPLRVPVCLNAIITGSHEEYAFNTVEIETYDYLDTKSVLLEGYITKPMSVNAMLYRASLSSSEPYYNFATSTIMDIQPNEYIIFSLRNIDTELTQATIITNNGMQQPLMLTPGYYAVDILVMKDLADTIVRIPEYQGCGFTVWPIPCIAGSYTIDEMVLEDSLVLASVSFSDSEPIYLSASDFDNGRSINLVVPTVDLSMFLEANRRIEHLSLISEGNSFMRSHGIIEVS